MFTLGNDNFNRLARDCGGISGARYRRTDPARVESTVDKLTQKFEAARASDNGSRDLDLAEGSVSILVPKNGNQDAYYDNVRLGGSKDDGWMETYRHVTFSDGRNPEEVTTALTLENGRAEEFTMLRQSYQVDEFTHLVADPKNIAGSGTKQWIPDHLDRYELSVLWGRT